MNTKSFSYCCCTIFFLVVLRVAIGWHCYHEGMAHLQDKKWSSRGFLANAVGPFASTAKSYIPDFHGWDRHMNRPFESKEKYENARKAYLDGPGKQKSDLLLTKQEHPFYANPTYGTWAKQVMQDWSGQVELFGKHYGVSNEVAAEKDKDKKAKGQHDLVNEDLQVYLGRLQEKLNDVEKDLFDYRSQLFRLEEMQKSESRDVVFESDRIKKLKTEQAAKPAAWIAEFQALENQLFDELTDKRLTDEQRKKEAFVLHKTPPYQKVDKIVTWVLIIGGGCLMIGLFTRTAAWACGLFLLSVVMLNPFWVSGAVETFYQWVELLALFALGTTNIGRFAGLDFFLAPLCGRMKSKCCTDKKQCCG